jgi:hypothetical protein
LVLKQFCKSYETNKKTEKGKKERTKKREKMAGGAVPALTRV